MPNLTPNRYGAKGSRSCRHRVPLWQICNRCNDLLTRIENPDRDNPHCQDPEFPTLFGTGNVVDFDPVAELEQLGDAGIQDPPPEGGGSIKA